MGLRYSTTFTHPFLLRLLIALLPYFFGCVCGCVCGCDVITVSHYYVFATPSPTYTHVSPLPTDHDVFHTQAGYDFAKLDFVDATVAGRFEILQIGYDSVVEEIDVGGMAKPNDGAAEPCKTIQGDDGDMVRDSRPGHSGVVCMAPKMWLTLEETGTNRPLYDRAVSLPMPPPTYRMPLPKGVVVGLGGPWALYQSAVTMTLHLRGTWSFDTLDFGLGIRTSFTK